MPIFFVTPESIQEHSAVIQGEDVRHIHRVLRLTTGDSLCLHDGEGHRYDAVIREFGKSEIRLEILGKETVSTNSGLRITIGQGIPKGQKMDWIVQKSTELGVDTIAPIQTIRSIPRPKPERASKKMDRWRAIAREASKQCGRDSIPEISHPMNISTFTERFRSADLKLAFWEDEKEKPIREVLENTKSVQDIAVVIGPEGGFDAGEIDLLLKNGFTTASLGPLVLRTETVSSAVLGILRYHFGDL